VILFARSVDIRVSLTKFASNFLLFRPKCCLQTSQAARLSSIDYVQLCVLMNVAFRFFSPLLEANRRPREWLSLLQGVSSDDGGARRLDLSTQLLRHFTDPSAGACRHDEKKEAPVKVGNPVFGNGCKANAATMRSQTPHWTNSVPDTAVYFPYWMHAAMSWLCVVLPTWLRYLLNRGIRQLQEDLEKRT
jgi:hypothetical protein